MLYEVITPEGAPAGEKEILKFQQAVFGTGLYKSVHLQKVKRPDEGILDLIVEVEETLFFEVEYGVGYGSYTRLRGFVGTKNKNLDRKGRRLSTRVSASEKEQIYLADLREPWVFGNRWRWEGGLTASHTESQRKSFSFRKTSVITSINKTIFARSSVSLQYELSQDDIFDVEPGAVITSYSIHYTKLYEGGTRFRGPFLSKTREGSNGRKGKEFRRRRWRCPLRQRRPANFFPARMWRYGISA